MPNIKSAAKAMRQSLRRKARNLKVKDNFKNAVKEVRKLVTSGKKSEAMEMMKKVMSTLDKAAKTNIIHKNKSARLKSRISKAISKLK